MAAKQAKSKKRNKQNPPRSGYSGTPLAKKLGLPGKTPRAVLEAPANFQDLIPEFEFDTSLDLDSYEYLHFFTASKVTLETIFPILSKRLNSGGILWISWPKKASGKQTDLGENLVRDIGLKTGLVDVKVCAIDETWSGLKFMHRTAK